MSISTLQDTATERLEVLEQHAARLQAHLIEIRALIDDYSGVGLLLPAADAEVMGLWWHLKRTESRLARCVQKIAEERAKARSAA